MLWKRPGTLGRSGCTETDEDRDKTRPVDALGHRGRRLIGQSEARRQVPHTCRYAERQAGRQRLVWFSSTAFCCFVIRSAEPGGDKVFGGGERLSPETRTRNSKTVKHSRDFKAAGHAGLLFQPQRDADRLLNSWHLSYWISRYVKDLRHGESPPSGRLQMRPLLWTTSLQMLSQTPDHPYVGIYCLQNESAD